MPKKQEDEDHHIMREAVFVMLAIFLVVVFGSFITGAVTFVFENAEGNTYNLTGDCSFEEDSMDCCENACGQWCALKSKRALETGVLNSVEVKCECTCSI